MGRTLATGAAINEALQIAMSADPDVILLGEDLAGGGDRHDQEGIEEIGGVIGTTRGLLGTFGADRVRDTPISEMGILGVVLMMVLIFTGMPISSALGGIGFLGFAYLGIILYQLSNCRRRTKLWPGHKPWPSRQ